MTAITSPSADRIMEMAHFILKQPHPGASDYIITISVELIGLAVPIPGMPSG